MEDGEKVPARNSPAAQRPAHLDRRGPRSPARPDLLVVRRSRLLRRSTVSVGRRRFLKTLDGRSCSAGSASLTSFISHKPGSGIPGRRPAWGVMYLGRLVEAGAGSRAVPPAPRHPYTRMPARTPFPDLQIEAAKPRNARSPARSAQSAGPRPRVCAFHPALPARQRALVAAESAAGDRQRRLPRPSPKAEFSHEQVAEGFLPEERKGTSSAGRLRAGAPRTQGRDGKKRHVRRHLLFLLKEQHALRARGTAEAASCSAFGKEAHVGGVGEAAGEARRPMVDARAGRWGGIHLGRSGTLVRWREGLKALDSDLAKRPTVRRACPPKKKRLGTSCGCWRRRNGNVARGGPRCGLRPAPNRRGRAGRPKEEVGLSKELEEFALVEAAEEHRLVHRDVPVPSSVPQTARSVRWSASGGDPMRLRIFIGRWFFFPTAGRCRALPARAA